MVAGTTPAAAGEARSPVNGSRRSVLAVHLSCGGLEILCEVLDPAKLRLHAFKLPGGRPELSRCGDALHDLG